MTKVDITTGLILISTIAISIAISLSHNYLIDCVNEDNGNITSPFKWWEISHYSIAHRLAPSFTSPNMLVNIIIIIIINSFFHSITILKWSITPTTIITSLKATTMITDHFSYDTSLLPMFSVYYGLSNEWMKIWCWLLMGSKLHAYTRIICLLVYCWRLLITCI